jgi:hypothetical protein
LPSAAPSEAAMAATKVDSKKRRRESMADKGLETGLGLGLG